MKTIVIAVAEYNECSGGLMLPACNFFTGNDKQTPEEEAAEWLTEDIKITVTNMSDEDIDVDETIKDMKGVVTAKSIKDEAEWDTPDIFENHWVKWKVFIKD